MSARLLLLEDDPAIARTVVYALQREGWQVTHSLLLQDARQHLAHHAVDALVLDLGLPDGNGLDLLRSLRAGPAPHSHLPVLVLSAQGEELDRVLGLELGADDYLSKPFSPRELSARVKALLRRSSPAAVPTPPRVLMDDAGGQRMLLRGQVLDLTRREYQLLACLLRGAGRIHSRDSLLDAVWGLDSDSTDRTVDTHIKTLRAKLREQDAAHEYIQTHRGMGYSLMLP